MRRGLSVCIFALSSLVSFAAAAPITDSEAIALAKKICAKNAPREITLHWSVESYQGLRAVSGKIEPLSMSAGFKGVVMGIPEVGESPKPCTRYSFE